MHGIKSARLSKTIADDAKARGSDYVLWDSDTKGLGLRVWPSSRKTFIFKYRTRSGRQRKATIGSFGPLTVDQARKIARKHALEVSNGEDPQARKAAARNENNMKELCDRYIDDYAEIHKKASSLRSDKTLIKNHVKPRLGRLMVSEVTNQDIHKLHKKMRNTPYQANRVVALLSKMFNLAELWGMRPQSSNPCKHLHRYKEESRDRYLSRDELANLGATLQKFEKEGITSKSVIAAIRLLVLTGCRLSEITTLKWSYVDFDRCCLRLPESKTGAKIVQIGGAALQLLNDLTAKAENTEDCEPSPYVVPGQRKNSPLINLQKPWRAIRKKAGLEGVRLHDLRHTFASYAAGANYSLPVIGKLLGHTQAATTQRYAHLASNPLKEAADRISLDIASALDNQSEHKLKSASTNVVALR